MSVKMYDGKDQHFLKACELADVNRVTRRQYKKWKQGRGKAHSQKEGASSAISNK